jgi:hypothetical protein
VVRGDRPYAGLRAGQRSAGEREYLFAGRRTAADEVLRDHDAVVVGEAEDALVEELVVQ